MYNKLNELIAQLIAINDPDSEGTISIETEIEALANYMYELAEVDIALFVDNVEEYIAFLKRVIEMASKHQIVYEARELLASCPV